RERMIGALLLGNLLLNTLAAAITTSILEEPLGQAGVVVATLVTTVITLIFAEVLPKTYAIAKPDETALFVSPFARIVVLVLSPFVRTVQWIVSKTLHLIRMTPDDAPNPYAAEEEIRGAVELHAEEGAVEQQAKHRIIGALDLSALTIADVMIHRK